MTLQTKRVLRLKGFASRQALQKALRIDDGDLNDELAGLVACGDVSEAPRGFSLTSTGRAHLASELAAERGQVDAGRIEDVYERFCALNGAFKTLIKDWQIRNLGGEEKLNDHTDQAYDAEIFARLREIDAGLQPVLAEIIALVPRLRAYPVRISEALSAVLGGDRTMMAAPIKDSYHTLWFELHEDLIDLSGRTRIQEAAAGRGD